MEDQYAKLLTEQRNQESFQLDSLSEQEIVQLFLQEEKAVDNALQQAATSIAEGMRMVATALQNGQIFLVGAGTSGRLGVLEASECPPTFGTSYEKVVAIMAGGNEAVFTAQEGAEDNPSTAVAELTKHSLSSKDLVIGITASGLTKFVESALHFASQQGTPTILITCNPKTQKDDTVQLLISLAVGPEVLTGSTRLKAGTATKRVLNILTTGGMTKIGKVYENLMVDVQMNSKKLEQRAIRIVSCLGQVDATKAQQLLQQTSGNPKVAIVMARKKLSYLEASQELSAAGGFLRKVID